MPKFNPDKDIPDLTGKVIIVTGGNIGLGKETVLQLSKHNPTHIFLAARTESKARAAIEDIRKAVPNAAPITWLKLNLASFDSIKQAVADFHTQSQQLHLLINNAAILGVPPELTKDGYEIQIGTNHMGPALFTKLLLPTLKKTAGSTTPPQDVRVVTVSSSQESQFPGAYDFSKWKTIMASDTSFMRYGLSKIGNIHYCSALARRNPDIRFISLHPGTVNTNISSGIVKSCPILKPVIVGFSVFLTPVSTGAHNQLWASVSPDAKSGEFYFPVGLTGKGSKYALEQTFSEQLFNWTEKELEAHA